MSLKANNTTFAKEEDDKKFETVFRKFDAHFLRHKNLIHERYCLFPRNQLNIKSIEKNVTQLYKFFETCEFEKMEPHNSR